MTDREDPALSFLCTGRRAAWHVLAWGDCSGGTGVIETLSCAHTRRARRVARRTEIPCANPFYTRA